MCIWFKECGLQAWTVHSVLAYESWVPLQEVGYTEDSSDFMDIKLKAPAMHRSQTQDIQYGEAAQGLNRYRAAMFAKGEFCERFQVIRISANIEPEGQGN